MTNLASWIHGRGRRLGVAAALFGAAVFLAAGESLPSAAAGTTRADLSIGAGGEGTGAEGRIQFKQKKRGERLKLRLDNLRPRTDYEIRDADTDDVLGMIRTDRRGRAKKTLRAGRGDSLSGALLEICEPGSDDPILEGKVPGEDGGMPVDGGVFLVGTVSTDPDAAVQVSITLSSTSGWDGSVGPDGSWNQAGGEGKDRNSVYDSISLFAGPGGVWIMNDGSEGGDGEVTSIPGPITFWIGSGEEGLTKVATIESQDGYGYGMGMEGMGAPDGMEGMIYPQPSTFSWYVDNQSEPGLPFGLHAVADLSGRDFEVRDGTGKVILEGVLPGLEEIRYDPLPEPLPCPGFPTFPGDGFHIDININIDLSGFDWNSIDFGSIDWNTFDWGSFDFGCLLGADGESFDFSKLLSGYRF